MSRAKVRCCGQCRGTGRHRPMEDQRQVQCNNCGGYGFLPNPHRAWTTSTSESIRQGPTQ